MIMNTHYIQRFVFYFPKIILALAIAPVFTAVSSDNPDYLPDNSPAKHLYNPYYGEDVDGEKTGIDKQALPQSSGQLVTMLQENLSGEDKSNITDLVYLHDDIADNENTYFFRIKNIDDVNKIFFALRYIYGSEIECDTCTILLTYQLKKKRLNIELLYNFLAARIKAPRGKNVPYKHPYHATMLDLFKSAGTKLIYITEKSDRNFPGNLSIREGTTIVLTTHAHMSIVRALPDKQYSFSVWNTEDGIYYKENSIGRPKHLEYDSIVGKFGIIEEGEKANSRS